MASVSLDKAPTIENRRAFTRLKDGSHIPGYCGFCPQLRYKIGRTYGNETHNLFKNKTKEMGECLNLPTVDLPSLPQATGDNKYFAEMVPGYSGYIPRMFTKFGATFRDECDQCVCEMLTNRESTWTQRMGLQKAVAEGSRLTAVSHDPLVRDHMNLFTEEKLEKLRTTSSKREMLEPPTPGYSGHIPRLTTTQVGMGSRYHMACRNSLELFDAERLNLRAAMTRPVEIVKQLEKTEEVVGDDSDVMSHFYDRGLIPKYMGYVPQRRFTFGKTYGDTTRQLMNVISQPIAAS